jgi:YHS domain-containing protein
MMEFLGRLLEFIAIVWLVRFLLRNVFASGNRSQASGQRNPFQNPFGEASQSSAQPSSGPIVITGEMKKDPQCGTYVSTELSLKSRYGGELIHFCSRECQEQFFQARSTKPA